MEPERRQHRRLAIRLPLECYEGNTRKAGLLRSVTRDISTGGLSFEAELASDAEPPPINSILTVELTIPPGDGHFPYEGHIHSVAEVVRCDVLENAIVGEGTARRICLAARFREPIKLIF